MVGADFLLGLNISTVAISKRDNCIVNLYRCFDTDPANPLRILTLPAVAHPPKIQGSNRVLIENTGLCSWTTTFWHVILQRWKANIYVFAWCLIADNWRYSSTTMLVRGLQFK